MKKTILFCLFGLAAAATPVGASIVLTADGSDLAVTAVPPPGSAGYDFFAMNSNGSDLVALPGYATVATAGDLRYGGGVQPHFLAPMSVNGTSYPDGTGIAYQGVTSGELAEITLGSGVPADFRLGLLTNYNGALTYQGDSSFTVNATGGASITVNNPPAYYTAGPQNDFYFVEVKGASPGDVLNIFGASIAAVGTQISIGGLTFDNLSPSVPEPGSAALLTLGGIGLVVGALRARRKAHRAGGCLERG